MMHEGFDAALDGCLGSDFHELIFLVLVLVFSCTVSVHNSQESQCCTEMSHDVDGERFIFLVVSSLGKFIHLQQSINLHHNPSIPCLFTGFFYHIRLKNK